MLSGIRNKIILIIEIKNFLPQPGPDIVQQYSLGFGGHYSASVFGNRSLPIHGFNYCIETKYW